MSTDSSVQARPLSLFDHPAAPWLVVLAGYAAMYLPVYWWAANGIWQSEEHGHGPLILVVLVWLFWTLRNSLFGLPDAPAHAIGWPVFALGVAIFVLGRAFGVSILELGSQPFIVAGVLLLMKGAPALRLAWFPIFYLIFMVPLPGFFVDAVTGPLKQWVSVIVESLLYAVGYPIARTGVTITIGQYQLLVADACSGLNSMFSLSALGTLFMFIMNRRSLLHSGVMLASILPIAFAANIVRVCALVLVTYHFGDEAGQGLLHGATGMLLMLVALVLLFSLDWLLATWVEQPAKRSHAIAPPR